MIEIFVLAAFSMFNSIKPSLLRGLGYTLKEFELEISFFTYVTLVASIY